MESSSYDSGLEYTAQCLPVGANSRLLFASKWMMVHSPLRDQVAINGTSERVEATVSQISGRIDSL